MAILVAYAHTFNYPTNLTTFLIGNGLMRLIVPIFSIVAGFFLYSAVARGKGRAWLGRVLMLYLFWMMIYLPFWIGYISGPVSLIKMFVLGYFHLWFMAGILIAGAMILILRTISERVAPGLQYRLLMGVAVVLGLAGVALQYFSLSGGNIGAHKYVNGVFMCFPFVTIGYLCGRRVKRCGIGGLPPRWLAFALTVLGVALLLLEAWLVQKRWGLDLMLDVPLATYLAAPALFILTLDTSMPEPPIRLDPISAAIYFMHVLALRLAEVLGFTALGWQMLFAIALPTLVALSLSRLGLPGFGVVRHSRPQQDRSAS